MAFAMVANMLQLKDNAAIACQLLACLLNAHYSKLAILH